MKIVLLFSGSLLLLFPSLSRGLTANKVEFEFHPGFYRVVFEYTLPEIKELREAQIEFRNRKKAEEVYWKLLKGADFYLGNPGEIKFINKIPGPEPW